MVEMGLTLYNLVVVADEHQFRDEPWITQPVALGSSTVLAAGQVRNVAGIPLENKRTLHSYGLIYMVDVDGYYGDDLGNTCDLNRGDVVWIQPGVAHAYGPKDGRSWTQVYLLLEGAQWTRWSEEGIFDARRPITHAEPVDYWRRQLHDVFTNQAAPTRATAMRTFGALTQLLLELLAAGEEAASSDDDVWLWESQHQLGDRRTADSATPQSVAHAMGMSYENFRKKFAERVGESPGQFQKRRRIEHACAAIYQGTHSFKALADELGFCDVFHFSKTFRQIVGETPSQFRRKARGV